MPNPNTFLEAFDTKGIVLTKYVAADNKLRLVIPYVIGAADNPKKAEEAKNDETKSLPFCAAAYILYLALLSHRRYETQDTFHRGDCFPSVNTLMRETGLGERRLRELLSLLKQYGFIYIVSGCDFAKKANQYFFPFEDFYDDEEDAYYHELMNKCALNNY